MIFPLAQICLNSQKTMANEDPNQPQELNDTKEEVELARLAEFTANRKLLAGCFDAAKP